ncbi:MAG: hypothetical protein A2170_03440 [Deltaproteobacteria bacterium RBG_13_53_10]|nr:MAG: hypothetical protein A2170_03440 [Deltaproteobacteria bacterium RBG_13_53_10]
MSWRKPLNGIKDLLRFAVLGFIDHLGLLVQIGYPLEKEVQIMYRAMFPVPSSSTGKSWVPLRTGNLSATRRESRR